MKFDEYMGNPHVSPTIKEKLSEATGIPIEAFSVSLKSPSAPQKEIPVQPVIPLITVTPSYDPIPNKELVAHRGRESAPF